MCVCVRTRVCMRVCVCVCVCVHARARGRVEGGVEASGVEAGGKKRTKDVNPKFQTLCFCLIAHRLVTRRRAATNRFHQWRLRPAHYWLTH